MRKAIIIWFVVVGMIKLLPAQCDVDVLPFKHGEKITMEISYNWSFIWVNAGTVFFKTDSVEAFDNKTYHFTSFGRSYDSWDWFITVRDLYESYVKINDLKPVFHQRKILEGEKIIYNKYRFNYQNGKIYSDLYYSDTGALIDTLKLETCTFDPLTAIYFARTIDFSNAQINQKFPIKILIDDEINDLYIRYMGEEKISDRQNIEYNCIKFSAKMVEGTIFSGGEDLMVWVSDDKNKIPILVVAEITFGSIKAYIQKAENLKYPFDAKLPSDK